MTAENFDLALITMRDVKPFRVFHVELHGGRKFEVDSPLALVVRNGVAVFIPPGGAPILFDHDSVNLIQASPANNEPAA